MDQVVTLLSGYLDYMPPELKDEQVVTAAADGAVSSMFAQQYIEELKAK